jgi:hypothetical protein
MIDVHKTTYLSQVVAQAYGITFVAAECPILRQALARQFALLTAMLGTDPKT